MNYADDTIQSYVSSWWIEDKTRDYRRGRLIKAYLPHVHQVPFTLIPEGRGQDPTDHTKIRYTMKELKLLEKRDLSTLYRLPVYAEDLDNGSLIVFHSLKEIFEASLCCLFV